MGKTVIEFFAGVGGFRVALNDIKAIKFYDCSKNAGYIRKEESNN